MTNLRLILSEINKFLKYEFHQFLVDFFDNSDSGLSGRIHCFLCKNAVIEPWRTSIFRRLQDILLHVCIRSACRQNLSSIKDK